MSDEVKRDFLGGYLQKNLDLERESTLYWSTIAIDLYLLLN